MAHFYPIETVYLVIGVLNFITAFYALCHLLLVLNSRLPETPIIYRVFVFVVAMISSGVRGIQMITFEFSEIERFWAVIFDTIAFIGFLAIQNTLVCYFGELRLAWKAEANASAQKQLFRYGWLAISVVTTAPFIFIRTKLHLANYEDEGRHYFYWRSILLWYCASILISLAGIYLIALVSLIRALKLYFLTRSLRWNFLRRIAMSISLCIFCFLLRAIINIVVAFHNPFEIEVQSYNEFVSLLSFGVCESFPAIVVVTTISGSLRRSTRAQVLQNGLTAGLLADGIPTPTLGPVRQPARSSGDFSREKKFSVSISNSFSSISNLKTLHAPTQTFHRNQHHDGQVLGVDEGGHELDILLIAADRLDWINLKHTEFKQ